MSTAPVLSFEETFEIKYIISKLHYSPPPGKDPISFADQVKVSAVKKSEGLDCFGGHAITPTSLVAAAVEHGGGRAQGLGCGVAGGKIHYGEETL